MKKGTTVVYFTKHTKAGPSSRHRSFQYFNYLQQNGYSITSHALFPNNYLPLFYQSGRKPYHLVLIGYARRFFQLLFLKKYDIIYIEYELFPFLPFRIEQIFLHNKQHIILDYDDAVFHNYDVSKNALVKKLCGDKIFRLVQLADCVITGSPYLTNALSSYAKKIVEIPTSIAFQRYQHATSSTISNEEQQPFRIGWIGSKTTSSNVLLVKETLLQLQQQYNILLVLIGFDIALKDALQGLHYTIHTWSEETEVSLLKTADVGIMPLRDTPFNQGKCGFKLIQYMACGLPTISTPLEANVKINHDGNNLFAETAAEWLACFNTIIQNKNYYKEVGKKNRNIVQSFYSAEVNSEKILAVLNEAVVEV